VTPVDATVSWARIAAEGEPVVLHDALCPMTPPDFIAACVERVLTSDAVVVGTRPVTDTVKVVTDGLVGATVDREGLLAVVSPLVLPADVAATLASAPSDLTRTVTDLAAAGHRVETVPAPPEAGRVTSVEALRLLEALTGER
jgi:2-C-methyl-D-erythritol 4-phosphate cytidylyltransferase